MDITYIIITRQTSFVFVYISYGLKRLSEIHHRPQDDGNYGSISGQ